MGRRSRKKRHIPPSVAVRMQRRQPARSSSRTWWWVGGGAAIALLALALWLALRPGETSPPPDVEPTITTEPTAAAEGLETEPATMPANPAERNQMYSAPPAMQIDPSKAYTATIETVKGAIVVRLDPVAAPQTVNNFVFLARQGFYEGLTFHRVEPGFVIQGGDPAGDGTGGPGYTIPAEIGLPHDEGVIAMARLADYVNPSRASSGSQFYITLAPAHHLDGGYTVFGQVIEGMEVVRSIAIGDVIERIVITEGN